MRETYVIIRNYLFNGAYAYALFGIYSLIVSPVITRFFDYGEKNIFIAISGFAILIAEFFALNFKLKMVRIRAQEKRIAYKKETGIDIIPSTPPIVFFGFFMRLAFHVVIVMVSMTALGFVCNDKQMSPPGIIALMSVFLLDIGGLIYMYFNNNFFTDPPQTKREFAEELKEEDDWDKINLPLASSVKYFRLELLSDIVLQIYTLMLFTSFWKFINQTGIEMLNDENSSPLMVFMMMSITVVVGLMPMRIAYWIEDSMEAFTTKEKIRVIVMFVIVAIFTCSPVIIKYITVFLMHLPYTPWQSHAEQTGFAIANVLFFLLLLIQIFIFRNKEK